MNVDAFVAVIGLGLAAVALPGGGRAVARVGGRRGGGPLGGRWRGAGPLDDTARWATRRDLGGLAVRGTPERRLVLGKTRGTLVAADADHSVLVVGPTQSGKTTAVAVPAILRWEGPVVAASVKGDLARDTAAWRAGRGTAWVYDPVGVAGPDLQRRGARSVHWTPVDAAGTWTGARRVAGNLVETARAGGSPMADGDFWYASAAKLLGPLVHAAAVGGGTMADVVRWLDEQDEDEPTAALVGAGADGALQAARACWGRDSRQRSGVYATAESVVEAYAEPPVADGGWSETCPPDSWPPGACLSESCLSERRLSESCLSESCLSESCLSESCLSERRPSVLGPVPWSGGSAAGGGDAGSLVAPAFSPEALVAGAHTLYLCAPAHHQRRLRPLFAALLGEVLHAAMDRAERQGRRLDPPLLLVVDEAANVAPIADLDVLAATAASHGVQLVTVWQDLAQVTARYGPRAGTVVNNHRAKLFLSGIGDPATLEHASTLVGEVERMQHTTTVDQRGQRSSAQAPHRERLAPPDALRRLAPGWGVLVSGHRQPCRLRLQPWFADSELRRRATTRLPAARRSAAEQVPHP